MDALEAMQHLSKECPRRILGKLHAAGHYRHASCPRYPGKVLCFHHDTEMPIDCTLTEAQLLAESLAVDNTEADCADEQAVSTSDKRGPFRYAER